jgi:Lsr2
MSQTTQIYLIDDIDGSENDVTTVRFSLDGTNYEIDLNAAHAADLRRALEPFVAGARRIARNGQTRTRSLSARARTAGIRAWAKDQGYEISELGRIPDTVLVAYENAH